MTPCGHIQCFPRSCLYEVSYDFLINLLEYFDDRADINNEGGPNKSMQFQTEIKQILGEF